MYYKSKNIKQSDQNMGYQYNMNIRPTPVKGVHTPQLSPRAFPGCMHSRTHKVSVPVLS